MSFTKKDKVLYYLILPHLEKNEEEEGGQIVGELYVVTYKDEDYESEDFKDLTDYIVLNFEPGTYDIFRIRAGGTKEFYASFSFSEEEKRKMMQSLPREDK